MKTKEIAGDTKPHALDSVIIPKQNNSWKNRLDKWNQPMTFDDRMSWLHTNYHRDGNQPDHFLFYLDIADQYGEGSEKFAQKPTDAEHVFTLTSYSSRADLKARLSKKAFSILCTEFFSSRDSDRSQFPFALAYKEPLFSKLLWFFRPYGGRGGWDNLRPKDTQHLGKDGGKHYLSVANCFAKEFALNAWQILNSRWYHCNDCDEPNPATAKPYLKEIITLVRHFRMLDDIGYGQYVPRPWVFKNMVSMVLEENNIPFDGSLRNSEDTSALGKLLEPLVLTGNDDLAKYLYIARLTVYDPRHNEGHGVLERK